MPSGIEENEDMTFIETDTLVNVAPSRMSTRVDRKVIPRDKWSQRMDMLLLQAYKQFPDNWVKISRICGEKRTSDECRDRYNMLKALRVEGQFSVEESKILRNAVAKYGKSWALIAKKCLKGRTAKQVRDHYMNTIAKNEQNKLEMLEIKEQQTCINNQTAFFGSPLKPERNKMHIRVSSFGKKQPEEGEEQGTVVQCDSRKLVFNFDENDSYFCQSVSKSPCKESVSIATFRRDNPAKQVSDSSIFTDLSIDEEMKGDDKNWYRDLDNKVKNRSTFKFQVTRKLPPDRQESNNSAEQYKNMLSICSRANNQNRDYISTKYIPVDTFLNTNNSKEPHELTRVLQTLKDDKSELFKSKMTFQDKWHH